MKKLLLVLAALAVFWGLIALIVWGALNHPIATLVIMFIVVSVAIAASIIIDP